MLICDTDKKYSRLAVVRGGGDLATGVIYRLWRAGFAVLSLEVERPTVVRRTVAVASAVFDGVFQVEDMRAVQISSVDEWRDRSAIAVMVDPAGTSIEELEPCVLVDAIMAKRNTGTYRSMAPLVLAIGPGFIAPGEVHGAVETKRGHYLGRLITNGSAIPNTGVPGMEMGYTVERLLRAPRDGCVAPVRAIGDRVEAGEIVAHVDGEPLRAQINGVLRGLIHPTVPVTRGMKIGDVDPRNEPAHCFSITDKALAIGGGILEAIVSMPFGDVR